VNFAVRGVIGVMRQLIVTLECALSAAIVKLKKFVEIGAKISVSSGLKNADLKGVTVATSAKYAVGVPVGYSPVAGRCTNPAGAVTEVECARACNNCPACSAWELSCGSSCADDAQGTCSLTVTERATVYGLANGNTAPVLSFNEDAQKKHGLRCVHVRDGDMITLWDPETETYLGMCGPISGDGPGWSNAKSQEVDGICANSGQRDKINYEGWAFPTDKLGSADDWKVKPRLHWKVKISGNRLNLWNAAFGAFLGVCQGNEATGDTFNTYGYRYAGNADSMEDWYGNGTGRAQFGNRMSEWKIEYDTGGIVLIQQGASEDGAYMTVERDDTAPKGDSTLCPGARRVHARRKTDGAPDPTKWIARIVPQAQVFQGVDEGCCKGGRCSYKSANKADSETCNDLNGVEMCHYGCCSDDTSYCIPKNEHDETGCWSYDCQKDCSCSVVANVSAAAEATWEAVTSWAWR